MEPIKQTIQAVIETWEVKKKASAKDNPRSLLKGVFTKKELEHLKFNYFKNGTLNINVDSSGWLYQLDLKKEALLTKLRKKSLAVKDIRFYLGEIK